MHTTTDQAKRYIRIQLSCLRKLKQARRHFENNNDVRVMDIDEDIHFTQLALVSTRQWLQTEALLAVSA